MFLFKIKGVRLSKFESKALEGIFVGYGAESHTYRIYDKTSGIVVESCSVEFDENNGSQVAQVACCDADDEIPQDAIGRWGWDSSAPLRDTLMADQGRTMLYSSGALIFTSILQASK